MTDVSCLLNHKVCISPWRPIPVELSRTGDPDLVVESSVSAPFPYLFGQSECATRASSRKSWKGGHESLSEIRKSRWESRDHGNASSSEVGGFDLQNSLIK